jgi:P2-related tail formation protein
MSKTIDQVSLLELLPPNLRGDPDIVAASQASDRDFQDLCGKIRLVYTIADIDHASSEVVDALAVEMNCDFYDQSLPLATRRRLVKNAYLYKYFMGTSYAVRKIVEDIYTGGCTRVV